MIGAPQPEDVIRASSKGILKTLDAVNDTVLQLFKESAKEFLTKCDGDAEKAICKTLAYISGYYKKALVNRSLITGCEKMVTV